jgi:hypothetical protein
MADEAAGSIGERYRLLEEIVGDFLNREYPV